MHINDTVYLASLSKREIFPDTAYFILCALTVLIYAINLTGNAAVIFSILLQKALRTPMNYLLLNLSIIHISSGTNILFFTFVMDTGSVVDTQKSQDLLCGYSEGVGFYSICATVYLFTLCAISVNRFLAVQFPTKKEYRMNKKTVIIYNVLAWFVCAGLASPSFLSFRYNRHLRLCLRQWNNIKHSFVYRIMLIFFAVTVPLVCFLLALSAVIWKRTRSRFNHQNSTSVRTTPLKKAEKLIALSMLILFICWIPFVIYWCLWTLGYFPGCSGSINAMKWIRVTILCSTINGAIDPFLYTCGKTKLRRAVKSCCTWLLSRTQVSAVNNVT